MSEPTTTDPTTLDTHVLQRSAEHLAAKYAGVFSPETVERYVLESSTTLSRTAKVRTYLASTATHFADDRLRALAQAEGKIASPVPQVLFVCVHNSDRSQLAAALLAHHAGDEVEVRSAGSLPGSEVHPLVDQVLAERGIDLAGAYPKPLTDDVVRAADYVITMAAETPAPSTRESATSTGRSPTLPTRRRNACARSSKRSTNMSARCDSRSRTDSTSPRHRSCGQDPGIGPTGQTPTRR